MPRLSLILLVGFAGALGTVARYLVGLWAGRALGAGFPFGTLAVNVVGCFLIAFVAELAASTTLISPTLRVTLTTGFMGGLTTYSSFNFETTRLLQERAWLSGALNFGATVVVCFLAGLCGLIAARRFTAFV